VSVRVSGKAWKFGDDVDTDQIYPGKYLPLTDKQEMAQHAMEGAENGETFLKNVRTGDIIVAGKNFGCGSSREHATVAIKGAGVSVIIARSFARIFHRNAVNTGLPILALEQVDEIHQGDTLDIDIEHGIVNNITRRKIYNAQPVSTLEMDIMRKGGLLAFLKTLEKRR
jgi:3-isopropylmalate/(R)-2-methylmalate dehydratase small subunit